MRLSNQASKAATLVFTRKGNNLKLGGYYGGRQADHLRQLKYLEVSSDNKLLLSTRGVLESKCELLAVHGIHWSKVRLWTTPENVDMQDQADWTKEQACFARKRLTLKSCKKSQQIGNY